MDIKSPFLVSEQELKVLEQNDGFRIVRAHLGNQENHEFCSLHSPLDQSTRQDFILHRDILHSLLLPLLQIRSQAAVFAARTFSHQTHSRKLGTRDFPRSIVDLELAFRGAARGAFSWLQCFIAEERDWCSTKGCPACIVLRVLHSEPFIRIVVTSCRLSVHLRDLLRGGEQSAQNRDSTARSTVPEFGFWLSAVRQAVSEDDFWGLHFWEDIEARVEDLELGVKDLIRQCCTVSSPSRTAQSPQRGSSTCRKTSQPVKNSSLVKRQMRLQEEEQEWMRKIIEACWLALLQEAAYKRSKVIPSASIRPGTLRSRSLTT